MNPLHRRRFLRLLPAAALTACNENSQAPPPKFPKVKWRITSTTAFTASLVREIGGEAVESQCFVPPGVNPHLFKPGAPDLAKLNTSDLVFTHGLGLENRWPAMNPDALTATGGVRVFCVTDRIPPERLRHPSGPAGPPDPHVWMHPGLAELMVTAVEEALKTVMPKLADYFTPRAYKLRLRLGDIMTTTTAQLRTLKPEARALFTSHDTMQYFAAAFGMEARALTAADGQLPETLSADLSAWIKAHSVQVLFRDATSDMLALRRLLQEARVNPDNIIHSLTLAPAGSTALVSLKSYDVSLAVEALACTADLIQFTLNVH